MPSWYCDHSKAQAAYADYASTPTAAGTVPTKSEDGNGKGSGTASMATLVITFTGIPSDGEQITIAGVTFTAKASGATGNQFNATADATTCATNLKNAINASTTSVVNPTMNSCPLRNAVNATSSGGVVTVYTRISGSEWNSVTETENLTNASITAQWSGGSDGAWGYFFNQAAISWPSSVAAGAYGGLTATYLGSPAAGDVIHIRTGRGSSNINLNSFGATGFTVNVRSVGTATSYLELRFDNGVVWNDGNSNGVFSVTKDASGGNIVFNFPAYCYWHGQMQSGTNVQSGGVVNCKFGHTATENSGYLMYFAAQSTYNTKHTVFEGIETADTGAGTYAQAIIQWANASGTLDVNKPIRLVNCKFGITRTNGGPFMQNGSPGTAYEAVDCLFAYGGATAYTGALTSVTTPTGPFSIKLVRPKFTGGGGGHHCLIPVIAGVYYSTVLIIEDPVDMGQFIASDSAASFCGRVSGQASVGVGPTDVGLMQTISSYSLDHGLLIDTPRKLIEWRNAGFPTSGISVLPNGTPYSLRFSVPHTGLASGLVNAMSPQRGLKQITTNTLGDGTYTLTEHLLIDSSYGGSSYTPTDAEWWIEGTYVSSVDGSLKRFSTRGTGTNLSSDTQSWSTLTYAPFSGGSRSYSRWKVEVTLTNVKDNTIVACWPVCAKQPSTMSEWAFICPHPQLT